MVIIDKAHARRTDPETSHAAAASVEDVTKTQQRVLDTLRAFGPLTDEQLCDWFHDGYVLQATDQSIRSRRAELVRLGLVEYSGQKGSTKTGRAARMWAATPTDEEMDDR